MQNGEEESEDEESDAYEPSDASEGVSGSEEDSDEDYSSVSEDSSESGNGLPLGVKDGLSIEDTFITLESPLPYTFGAFDRNKGQNGICIDLPRK